MSSIPCDVRFTFGKDLDGNSVNPEPMITEELKDRLSKLLKGEYIIDDRGRCVIDPAQWNPIVATRDSICVEVDIFVVSIQWCKDI